MRLIPCAALAALLPLAAAAEGAITLTDGYVRSGNPKSAAAFMLITNNGSEDCRLSGVESDAAARVELHTHREEDGVMKMVAIPDGIAIPAGGTHELARGGDHVMLMGLHQPLAEGDSIGLALDFGDCGTVLVELPVANQADSSHDGHGQDDNAH